MHAANLRDMGEIGEAGIFHVQMFLQDIPGPGTRLPQQQMFIEQIPDPAGFIREAVARRADRNERLGAVNVGVKFGRIVIAFHQAKWISPVRRRFNKSSVLEMIRLRLSPGWRLR